MVISIERFPNFFFFVLKRKNILREFFQFASGSGRKLFSSLKYIFDAISICKTNLHWNLSQVHREIHFSSRTNLKKKPIDTK